MIYDDTGISQEYVDDLLRKLSELQDRLSRRNMQIRELKKKLQYSNSEVIKFQEVLSLAEEEIADLKEKYKTIEN